MTEKQKIGYKVLQVNRKSAVMYDSFGCLYYHKGKKVTPKKGCGPLCVFSSFYDARVFVEWLTDTQKIIIKCYYKPSSIDYVWDEKNKKLSKHLIGLPKGTVLADSVTCLE